MLKRSVFDKILLNWLFKYAILLLYIGNSIQIGETAMKNLKRTVTKSAAFLLTLALVFALVPSTLVRSVASSGEVTVGVMNDLHYFPSSLMGSDINAFIEASKLNSTTSYLAEALLDNALNEYRVEAAARGLKYLIIPGDLTKNGEYEGHRELAAKL